MYFMYMIHNAYFIRVWRYQHQRVKSHVSRVHRTKKKWYFDFVLFFGEILYFSISHPQLETLPSQHFFFSQHTHIVTHFILKYTTTQDGHLMCAHTRRFRQRTTHTYTVETFQKTFTEPCWCKTN